MHRTFELSRTSDEDEHDAVLVLFLRAFEDARLSEDAIHFEINIPEKVISNGLPFRPAEAAL